jgi:hypothetical protein
MADTMAVPNKARRFIDGAVKYAVGKSCSAVMNGALISFGKFRR